MRDNRNDELEMFKSQINLVEYASTRGYEYDYENSSKNSTIMRNSKNDKIIIATGQDNHSVYFSVTDPNDNGSIIDFIQKRENLNLGQVRKELRKWIGQPVEEIHRYKKPLPSTKDTQKVLMAYAKTVPITWNKYLLSRGISKKIQEDERFKDIIREDQRGNAIFPHFSDSGQIVGFEIKNTGFTGFSTGGKKGIWASKLYSDTMRIIFVESAIDALSHAQIHKTGLESLYCSVGGQLSPEQRETLTFILKKAEKDAKEVIIATDNDDAGYLMAQKIKSLNPATKFLREIPKFGKDWNDQLQYDNEKSFVSKLPFSIER